MPMGFTVLIERAHALPYMETANFLDIMRISAAIRENAGGVRINVADEQRETAFKFRKIR